MCDVPMPSAPTHRVQQVLGPSALGEPEHRLLQQQAHLDAAGRRRLHTVQVVQHLLQDEDEEVCEGYSFSGVYSGANDQQSADE
jgi:hypothetical protein